MGPIELRQKILEIIEGKHNSSNGSCGVSPVDIKVVLGVDYRLIAEQLNHLHQNKLIIVREGINGYLLFKQKPLN